MIHDRLLVNIGINYDFIEQRPPHIKVARSLFLNFVFYLD
jgi:hypothetical protein